MVSITQQKYLISHTIALILETHAIATISIETRENHNTSMPQVNPNVTTVKANNSSKGAKSLSRTRPSTS